MALETVAHIADLNVANPTAADPKSQGDDQIRNIKTALKTDLPNVAGPITASHTELNFMVGATTNPAMKDGSNLTTPALGDSSTKIATTAFVAGTALAATLPAQTGNSAKVITTDGANASWASDLKAGTIRVVDSTDTTKKLAFSIAALATGTTRTASVPDHDFALGLSMLIVSERQTSGTAAGGSAAADYTQTRTINTTDLNTISGASLASNTITLPAGTFLCIGRAPARTAGMHQASLYNTADSAYTLIGSNSKALSTVDAQTDSVIMGAFTIAAAKTFKVRHYTEGAIATNGLGAPASTGQSETYSQFVFVQVA